MLRPTGNTLVYRCYCDLIPSGCVATPPSKKLSRIQDVGNAHRALDLQPSGSGNLRRRSPHSSGTHLRELVPHRSRAGHFSLPLLFWDQSYCGPQNSLKGKWRAAHSVTLFNRQLLFFLLLLLCLTVGPWSLPDRRISLQTRMPL